ncbi:transmembrane protease serine 9-like [Limanda limanda]|uniref:transmembrane protease serine 9-like n=1 Tax=Limanda limanda TaxID=27771 RepID=UPI0029C7A51A|nr:transmembrane protease serine 9-like [Limanda limanda]
MSAAHCFTSSSTTNLVMYLGRQRQEGPNPNEVSSTVSTIINHPDYNSRPHDNDISLLKLSSPVTFTNYILPVCLAAPDSVFHSGTGSWVTGWGNIGQGVPLPSPQNLMEVEVPVVGNRQCNCDYGVGRITDNMICAGLRDGGKDSCQGDSGGPMVSKQNSRWVLEGVVSFGNGCALPKFPGVYTRVSRYQAWINSHITTNRPGYVTFSSSGTDSDLSVTCTGVPVLPPTTTTTTTTPPTTTAQPVVCGRAPLNTRIPGGSSVVTAGVWPWMVSLQQNGRHVCGGALVAVDAVLSQANCFSSSPTVSEWTVVLGRLKQNGSNPFEVTLSVRNITLSNLTGSNVALLSLESRPALSDYIQPLCLDTGRSFSVGSTCWASGWSSDRGGEEQVLQEVQTLVSDCGNASSTDSFCTGSLTLEQGASGGPLMCKQDGSWFQASVLSAETSTTTTRADPVTVFPKLNKFQTFLSKNLGKLLSPASSSSNTTAANSTAPPTTSSGATTHFLLHLLLLSPSLQLFL